MSKTRYYTRRATTNNGHNAHVPYMCILKLKQKTEYTVTLSVYQPFFFNNNNNNK